MAIHVAARPACRSQGCSAAGDDRRLGRSAEERVKVIVRTDPNPDNRVTVALAHSPVLLVDSHGPDVVIAAQFLETEGGMLRVFGKNPVRPARSLTHARVQRVVRSPEARPSKRFQRRLRSMGVAGSAADSARNASNLGRRWPAAINFSHRSSSCRASRNRAKSATSARLPSGSASQMRISS